MERRALVKSIGHFFAPYVQGYVLKSNWKGRLMLQLIVLPLSV
jgi:hypothetical protein